MGGVLALCAQQGSTTTLSIHEVGGGLTNVERIYQILVGIGP